MHRKITVVKTLFKRQFYLTIIFIGTIFSSIDAQYCNLPETLPESLDQLDDFNLDIAYCFAPHVHHLVSGNEVSNGLFGRADLITSVFFDGDINTHNNWDALEDIDEDEEITDELDPVVYYSVVWSESYWYIIYAFYHARDFATDAEVSDDLNCHILDAHHSDMEGLILKVKRPIGNMPAFIEASKSGCHHGYDIRPEMESWGDEIPIQLVDETHPVITIDNATHCVKHDYLDEILDIPNPCEPDAVGYIDYVPTLSSASIDIENQIGHYILEDIHKPGGLWSLRNNEQVFFTWGKFPNTINNVFAKAPWEWVAGGLITDDPQLFFIDMCHDQSVYQINQYISDDIPLEEGPCVPPVDFIPEEVSITVYAVAGQDLNIDLSLYSTGLGESHVQFQEIPPFGTSLSGHIFTIRHVEDACYTYEMLATTECKIEPFTLKIKVRILDGPWYPHGLVGPPKYIIKPNPVINNLTIDFLETNTDEDYFEYFIFSEHGELLETGLKDFRHNNIETSLLNSDTYYLTIKTNSFIQSQSFIKI